MMGSYSEENASSFPHPFDKTFSDTPMKDIKESRRRSVWWLKLCVLTKRDFNFCVRSSPLRSSMG